MTTHGATRRSIAVALATLLVGAVLSLLVGALTQPATAREFEGLVVTKDAPTFATFDGIPNSLSYPRKPDPDFCREADYCDTIPVKIPIPDIPPSAGYKLVFKANNTDGANLDVYLWDDKQLKAKYGKCPAGETCYDPLESEYTDILAITDLQTGGDTSNGVYEVGRPDLVDYSITVLNFGGTTSTGYTIYMALEVQETVPPDEVLPPDNSTTFTQTGSVTAGIAPTAATPQVSDPVIGDPADLPTLNDLLIARDPDLLALQEQDLADELAAPPTPISQLGRNDSGPPPPVSGLTLILWLAVVPAGLAGGASALVQRRRVQILDLV